MFAGKARNPTFEWDLVRGLHSGRFMPRLQIIDLGLAVANTLAYYNSAKIMALKIFKLQ
jgi:hypothetical protein